ncbi:MAG: hypothetical protein EOO04_35980, partial [Chitinophagaceae bacterium]
DESIKRLKGEEPMYSYALLEPECYYLVQEKEDSPIELIQVKVKSDQKDDVMDLTLVTPDMANIKEKKISVMAPIGTALIGFRQGQKVKWQVPAGKKTFTILEVINEQ